MIGRKVDSIEEEWQVSDVQIGGVWTEQLGLEGGKVNGGARRWLWQ
jgi:hypothetical protein